MEDESKTKGKDEKKVIVSVEIFNTMMIVAIFLVLIAYVSAQMMFNYVLYRQSESRLDYAIIGAIVGNPTAQEFLEIRKESQPKRKVKSGK